MSADGICAVECIGCVLRVACRLCAVEADPAARSNACKHAAEQLAERTISLLYPAPDLGARRVLRCERPHARAELRGARCARCLTREDFVWFLLIM